MSNELINYEQLAKDFLNTLTCEQLTAQEQQQFIMLAQGYNLNPFKKEIYAIKFNNKFQIVVSYLIVLATGQSQPGYDGFKIEYYSNDKRVICFNSLTPNLVAVTTIYKRDANNVRYEYTQTTVNLNEYSQQRNNGFAKSAFTSWAEKIAITNAFRRSFAGTLNNVYIEDELLDFTKPAKITPIKQESNYTNAVKQLETIEDLAVRKAIIQEFLQENNLTFSDFKLSKFDLEKFNEKIKQEVEDAKPVIQGENE